MDDLVNIINLGFSGSDIWRGVICAFFTAMLVNKKAGVWGMGGVALLIDRLVWPVAEQSFLGAEPETLIASVSGVFETLPDNAGLYLVRYLGLVVMISVFLQLRKRLHGDGASQPAKKPAAA